MIFLPLLFLQIIFLVVWYLIIFRDKKYIFIECIILVLLCISYRETFKQRAVIKIAQALLYAGPGEDYHQINNVTNDTEVEIHQRFGDWLKIHYNNVSGWIKAHDIQEFS